MKTKENWIEDAGRAETTGILRPQRTGPQNDNSQREGLESKSWRIRLCHKVHDYKVHDGHRSPKNSRNEAGMSVKVKDTRFGWGLSRNFMHHGFPLSHFGVWKRDTILTERTCRSLENK
jgi:hypothetical protein